jgi:hypothetical protein
MILSCSRHAASAPAHGGLARFSVRDDASGLVTGDAGRLARMCGLRRCAGVQSSLADLHGQSRSGCTEVGRTVRDRQHFVRMADAEGSERRCENRVNVAESSAAENCTAGSRCKPRRAGLATHQKAYASDGSMVLQAAMRPLTASTDFSNIAFSLASSFTSTTRSTPLAPMMTGTPTYMPLRP